MEFQRHSPEAVAELLIYLADHERFESLKGLGEFSQKEVKNLFYEMANQLKEVSQKQPLVRRTAVNDRDLTDNIHKVITNLSPYEENVLFKSFRIS